MSRSQNLHGLHTLRTRFVLLLMLLALAAACARAPVRNATSVDLAQLGERERMLADIKRWSLSGRLAVSNAQDSGSGRVEWRQNGEVLTIELSAPVSRRAFRLRADASGAMIEGGEDGPKRGPDPESLLAEIGWTVPIDRLRAWARGVRADGPADVQFGNYGLPVRIVQDGWQVEYRDWYREGALPLPRRIFAQRGDTRVRLVVDRWDLDPASAQ